MLVAPSAGNTTDYMWCNQWWTMADMERPVVNHYQLPVISFRDTVWPRLSEPRPDLPCLWNGGAHPDELAHILFADVVAYGLMQAMQHSEQHTAASPGECASFVPSRRFYSLAPLTRFCLRKPRGSIDASPQQTPGTFFDVSNPDAFVPHAVSGAWEFREDRPGKPGWVCEPSFRRSVPSNATTAAGAAAATRNDSSHTIWFRVTFSDEPQLQVTYLTTYQNIGAVEVFLYTEAGKSELAAVAPSNHSALAAYQVLRLALIMLHFSWRGAATSSSC